MDAKKWDFRFLQFWTGLNMLSNAIGFYLGWQDYERLIGQFPRMTPLLMKLYLIIPLIAIGACIGLLFEKRQAMAWLALSFILVLSLDLYVGIYAHAFIVSLDMLVFVILLWLNRHHFD
jgi:hypothetical protein